MNVFNPELVVLSGLYHRLYDRLEKAVLTGIEAQILEAPYEQARIASTKFGAGAHLIGAAELVQLKVMDDPARLGEPFGTPGIRSVN